MKPNIIFEREITDAGGTDALSYSKGYTAANLYTSGAVTLLGNYSINFSGGTAVDGEEFEVHCNLTQLTLGGFTCSVMGYSVPQAVLSAGPFIVKVTIINNAKIVTVIPSFSGSQYITSTQLAANAVTTNKVTDNAVTYAKIQDFAARGYLLRGGAAGEPEGFNAVTSGQLVGGDGTDVKSMPVTGDVTFAHSGGSLVTTIAAGSVEPSMLSFTLTSYLNAKVTLSSSQILALFSTPVTIIPAPGSGNYIKIISATAYNNFNSAAYANGADLLELRTGANINWSFPNSFTEAVADQIHQGTQGTGVIASNTAITATTTSADPTTGDGTITIDIVYSIVSI